MRWILSLSVSIMFRPTQLVLAGLMCLVLAAPAWAVTATRAPYTRIDPANGKQITPDENAIWLENEHLKLAIMAAPPHTGEIFSMVYKPMSLELGNQFTLQGLFWDRNAGNPVYRKIAAGSGEIVSQSEDQAQVRVTYVESGNVDSKQVQLTHTKTFTLKQGAAFVLARWKVENTGEGDLAFNPGVKHVGRTDDALLQGPCRLMLTSGPTEFRDFIKPATNWTARLSGNENSESAPMLVSVADYGKIMTQFSWRKPPRQTLETIFTRASLKPGESYEVDYALAVAANLKDVSYGAPELSASIEPAGELKAGQTATLTVRLAPSVDLGEKRLEGGFADNDGKLLATVPHQQVVLTPGKITSFTVPFTPPADGVYWLNLKVFNRQTPIRLGLDVASQRTHIALPVFVGKVPEVAVKEWDSDAAAWPTREARALAPWRTLVNDANLKAGQVLVPERIFPEDKFTYDGKTQPAAIRLAGGEYECLQFAVEVPEKANALKLSADVSPLKNDKGIALEQVELREQIYLTTDTPSDYMSFPVGQWPDPLFETDWQTKIPDAPITKQNLGFIEQTGRRVYWLTVRAQPDAPAGVYKGTVKLALAGKPAGQFPVEVRINGFSLPEHVTFRASTGMVGWRGSRPSNWEILGLPPEEVASITTNAMDQYRRLVIAYGWTPTMWFGDWKTWEQYQDVGRGPSVFPGDGGKENEQWLIENGLLKYAFTYAPFDEHSDGKVPEVAEWARKWKAESKIPVLDCYYGSNVEPLFGLVDVWLGQSPLSSWWGEPTPPLGWGHKAVERKKAGDMFYSCNASLQWHVEYVPAQGRSEIWADFAAGVDGRYVYSTPRWTDDVYKKNWTTGNYMGCVVYPGPHGITTSIRFETMRDALEDYDYLTILRDTVAKAEDSGKAPAALIAEAKAIIGDPKIASKVNTVESVNAMRDRIADLIEGLTH